MIFEAQIKTQELNATSNGIGSVYLYRINKGAESTEQKTELKYWSAGYEDFMQEAEKNNTALRNYFTINEEGEIVVVEIETTIVKQDVDTEGKIDIPKPAKKSYKVTPRALPYKDLISQYTTPMSFFITLGMMTRNPSFIEAVAELVKDNSKIELTVVDTTVTEVRTQVDTSTEYTITRTAYWGPDNGYIECETTDNSDDPEEVKITETTTTTVITESPALKVTYANSWVGEQTTKFSKLPSEPVPEPQQTIEQKSDSPKSFSSSISDLEDEALKAMEPVSEKLSWTTREPTTIDIIKTIETYDSGTSSGYIDKTDEFINLLDVKYTLPNSKEKRTAGSYLKTDADMLFALLQQNSETQGMELVMRYIMQKYDRTKDYEAPENLESIFGMNYFSTINGIYGSTIEDKVWYALKRLGYSNEVIAGAMGNISCESGFSSTALNSSSGAYGLAQWLGGRRTSLQEYASSKGTTEEDVDTQIEFLIAEITGQGNAVDFAKRRTAGGNGENYHTYNDWANATTVEDAAVAYCWFFETPSTSSTKTDDVIKEEKKRKEEAQKYYELYKNKGNGGEYITLSDGYGVRGYYTAPNGRTFTILNQTIISGWSDKCNRAACAIIASGYSNESSAELINSINSASRDIYGAIPGTGSSYWSKYGLYVTSYESNPSDYKSKLREQLISGGYALLWLNNNSSTYKGKSGITWTTLYHWVAVLDYRNMNGNDEICVADWRGIKWVGIDEFETHGVDHMVFVNEK